MGRSCFCVSVGTSLGGKSVAPLTVETTLGDLALGMDLLNITASDIIADVCVSPSVTNGTTSDLLLKEWINFCTTRMYASAEYIFGMVNLLGKKPNVPDILSPLVL